MLQAAYQQNSNLVLRVQSPAIQSRLRDKMLQAEEETAQRFAPESGRNNTSAAPPSGGGSMNSKEDHIVALDGVQCIPCEEGSTLWYFQCDGIAYPARLTNLPCPDIGQMLIVYEDEADMEENEKAAEYNVEGFSSYYYSGLTPPMKRVVARRFAAREHKSVAPPRAEVADIEKELKSLIATISKDTSKIRGKNSSSSAPPPEASKVIEELLDEVVTYEQWMDDYGNQPRGIEFDEKDKICTTHPEVWLTPEEYEAILGNKKERKESSGGTSTKTSGTTSGSKKKNTKNKKQKEKKESSKKKKEAAAAIATEDTTSISSKPKKKGIAAKKNRNIVQQAVNEVDQAAAQIVAGDDGDALEVLGDLFDFNAEDDIADFLKQEM